jgi:hypothetical protein
MTVIRLQKRCSTIEKAAKISAQILKTARGKMRKYPPVLDEDHSKTQ